MRNNSVESLIEQRRLLDLRIQKLTARHKAQIRKDRTRKLILLGAHEEEMHIKAGTLKDRYAAMDSFLYKDKDRALFDLPPRIASDNQKTSVNGS